MIATGMTTMKERIAAAALACVGWCALALQYYLLSGIAQETGLSWGESLLRFLSYFTIQCNVLVALVLSAFALREKHSEWTVHPFERSAIASYIAVVAVVYVASLRDLWEPQGAQWLADVLLHYFMPLTYLAFWLVSMHKAGLRWYDPLLWLIYPLFYLGFVLVHGRWSGFYPYPFIDVSRIGYGEMTENAIGVLLVFLVSGYAILAVSRLLARREPV